MYAGVRIGVLNMPDKRIEVDYNDFVAGVKAQADLESIRDIVQKYKYTLDAIEAVRIILGIEVKSDE